MEVTPGSKTTEFKITVIAIVVGTILEGVATVLHTLQGAGVAAPWFPAVLSVIGILLPIAGVLGYQKARAQVKAAALIGEGGALTKSPS